jgi:hypothetical protein
MGWHRGGAPVILHVLTAVTRPENLPEIAESLMEANSRVRGIDLTWHRLYDLNREYVGGQTLKNRMLDTIRGKYDWVVILDDDTLMHPQFFRKISWVILSAPLVPIELRAVVVSQKRVDGSILQAAPENAVVGMIDAGQAALRRDLIGDYRIPETYAGDGMWLETLLRDRPDVHYMREVLSLHNAISGVDVGPVPA